jgi:predicted DNA-binding protein (MmcQ/YjbR family)
MDVDELRSFCLGKKGVTEDFPFDDQTLAFRVMGKIFLLCDIYAVPLKANLKCEPALAIELREKYPAVEPGWHMNKTHWNTVTFEGLSRSELADMIDHSYERVISGLPKSSRLELAS